jgi:hypothetical protein
VPHAVAQDDDGTNRFRGLENRVDGLAEPVGHLHGLLLAVRVVHHLLSAGGRFPDDRGQLGQQPGRHASGTDGEGIRERPARAGQGHRAERYHDGRYRDHHRAQQSHDAAEADNQLPLCHGRLRAPPGIQQQSQRLPEVRDLSDQELGQGPRALVILGM